MTQPPLTQPPLTQSPAREAPAQYPQRPSGSPTVVPRPRVSAGAPHVPAEHPLAPTGVTAPAPPRVTPAAPRLSTPWARVELAGTPVDLLDWDEALDLIRAHARTETGPALGVMSANLDHLHHFGAGGPAHDTPFLWAHPSDTLNQATAATPPDAPHSVWGEAGTVRGDTRVVRWLALLDGAPLVARATALTGRSWPRLAGSDVIIPLLDAAAEDGLSVGFLGGSEPTQQALQHRLALERPTLRVAGWWAPSRAEVTDPVAAAALAAHIAQAGPDILVVGLGKPRQERWITEHGAATGARVLLAFGAVVDFLAGQVPRAPEWWRAHGLEWAWRLGLEPRRLARRYLIEGPPSYVALRRHARLLDPGAPTAPTAPTSSQPTPARPVDDSPGTGRWPVADFAGPDQPAQVAALIVTHNNADDLEPLLASLHVEAAQLTLRVVVVDNASTDGTLERAQAHPGVIAVASGGNLGYAGGINVAARHAGQVEALLILNPDLLVMPGAISALWARLAREPRAGAVVPMLVDKDGAVYPSLRREPTPLRSFGDALCGSRLPARPGWLSEIVWDPGAYRQAHRVDWATGAAVLVRASAADMLGDWDERFFLYSEETDYFHRMRGAGWHVWYDAAARMRHTRGGSGSAPQLTALMEINRVRYQRLHAGRNQAMLTGAAVLLGSVLRSHDPGHRQAAGALLSRARRARLPHATPAPHPPEGPVQGSVVIPAHNEATVLARTLTPLAPLTAAGTLEVIVVANGCTDATAAQARQFPGVHVIEIATASKTAALRAGDQVATRWPRLYLDADVQLDARTVAELLAALSDVSDDGPHAARPVSVDDTTGAHWLVRCYYRARRRLPGLHEHLWGAGAYAVSQAGRARWGEFPDVVADDLWVDSLFSPQEKVVVGTVPAVVRAPRTVPGLLAVLRRAQRGKTHLVSDGLIGESAGSTLRHLSGTVRGVRSGLDALVYAGFALLARTGATTRNGVWERDESSRR